MEEERAKLKGLMRLTGLEPLNVIYPTWQLDQLVATLGY